MCGLVLIITLPILPSEQSRFKANFIDSWDAKPESALSLQSWVEELQELSIY